jgi:hypothetical protein
MNYEYVMIKKETEWPVPWYHYSIHMKRLNKITNKILPRFALEHPEYKCKA